MITNAFKAIGISFLSLGLIAGSVVTPLLNRAGDGKNTVLADSQLDFVKGVRVSGTTNSFVENGNLTLGPADQEVTVMLYYFIPQVGVTYQGGVLHDQLPLPDSSNTVLGSASITFTNPAIGRSWGTAGVVVPAGKKLVYEQGSLIWMQGGDPTVHNVQDVNGVNPVLVPQGLPIGDVLGGDPTNPNDPNMHYYYYKMRVVDASTPTFEPAPRMDFVETVANATTNSAFANTLTISDGQTAVFKIWVHDGVVGSTARGEVVKATLDTTTGTTHNSAATLTTSNAGSPTTSSVLLTATSLGLRYVAGSTRIIDHNGNATTVADVNGTSPVLTSAGLSLGDQPGCFEFEKFVTFQVTTTAVAAATTSAPATPATPATPVVNKPAVLPATGPESLPQLILAAMIPVGALLRRLKV